MAVTFYRAQRVQLWAIQRHDISLQARHTYILKQQDKWQYCEKIDLLPKVMIIIISDASLHLQTSGFKQKL